MANPKTASKAAAKNTTTKATKKPAAKATSKAKVVEEAEEIEEVEEDTNDDSVEESEDYSESEVNTKGTKTQDTPYSDKYSEYLEKALRHTEKKLSIISSSQMTNQKMSTGCLVLDFMMGGGIVPGAFTFSGPEASGKSTNMLHILKSALSYRIPFLIFNDAEGSVQRSVEYAENIFRVPSLSEVFSQGGGNPKDNRGKIRYYCETGLEKVMTMINHSLMALPDQTYRADTNTWYRVWRDDPKHQQLMKAFGDEYDKRLHKDTGLYWCPLANCPPLQGLVGLDSYPSLIPTELDGKDEDDKTGMALLARKYSEYFPRIVGKLNKKAVALIGVNQIRKAPMVMYGCFTGDTEVLLADGTMMKIGQIVEGRLPVEVLSYNTTTNNYEPRKVVNWFKNGISQPDEFVRLEFTVGQIDYMVYVTKGHKIWTMYEDMRRVEDVINSQFSHVCVYKDYGGALIVEAESQQLYIQTEKYDIEVEGNHTYLVTKAGVIAHNSPNYEPCGETLKFRSDFRAMVDSRTVPREWPKGKDPETGNPTAQYTEEVSWTDPNAKDRYAFKMYTNIKNKFGTPYIKVMARIWIKDANGYGRGIDPVFDTYQYLEITGQIVGGDFRKKFKIDIDGLRNAEFDWHKFKGLVLSELDPAIAAAFKKEYGVSKLPKLQQICLEQIRENKAINMYNAAIHAKGGKKKKGVDLDGGTDDDDDDNVEEV